MKKLNSLLMIGLLNLVFAGCAPEKYTQEPDPVGFFSLQKEEKNLTIPTPEKRFEKLSESAFFNAANSNQYLNLIAYQPQYPLFSDHAEKKRWIYLPQNEQVDNSDPDNWTYPRGTILYKEFSLNGKKIETRVLEKIKNEVGFEAWRTTVYIWKADQSDADRLKTDEFTDLPSSEQSLYQAYAFKDRYKMVNLQKCQACHEPAKDSVQGFSYLQLSNPQLEANIITLNKNNLLKNPVTKLDEIQGSIKTKAAIGYIQANCATCHSENGMGSYNFKHSSLSQTLEDEPFMKSLKEEPSLITFGNTSTSSMYRRLQNGSMPRIRGLLKDEAGLKVLSDWILE